MQKYATLALDNAIFTWLSTIQRYGIIDGHAVISDRPDWTVKSFGQPYLVKGGFVCLYSNIIYDVIYEHYDLQGPTA